MVRVKWSREEQERKDEDYANRALSLDVAQRLRLTRLKLKLEVEAEGSLVASIDIISKEA